MEAIHKWTSEGRLSQMAAERIERWLTDSAFAEFRGEILDLIRSEDIDELEDSFRTQIVFGTGGIRGKMGPGPNRINSRTLGEAAQGLARHILNEVGQKQIECGVAIANDTRVNSDRFARDTATIIAANGITAHLFDGPRSTPELSFAVRKLNAVAGIVISASHNPPQDNGFKAYWSDGAQVVPPHDAAIIAQAEAVTHIRRLDYDKAIDKGLIKPLGKEVDDAYIQETQLHVSDARLGRIVFTPLHGVGATSILPALGALGFSDVHVVDAQNDGNGNFPTLPGGVANPESPEAMTLAIQKATEIGADLVIASDPDADRLGCALPLPDCGWDAAPSDLALNGNQIGALLCHYILSGRKARGELPARPVVCETIVTTDLTGLIAQSFGARVVDNLLVGFKYIAAAIASLDQDETFLFGTEESHGYLATDVVRDKDAASAAMLLAQCVADALAGGRTARDVLDDVYREHGYFRELQKSVTRAGAAGGNDIRTIMTQLRQDPPTAIGSYPVIRVVDYQTGGFRNLKTGDSGVVEGEKGNVLAFTLSDAGHTRVTVRPSGTEPKIKYYVSASSIDVEGATRNDLAATKKNVDTAAHEILDAITEIAESTVA